MLPNTTASSFCHSTTEDNIEVLKKYQKYILWGRGHSTQYTSFLFILILYYFVLWWPHQIGKGGRRPQLWITHSTIDEKVNQTGSNLYIGNTYFLVAISQFSYTSIPCIPAHDKTHIRLRTSSRSKSRMHSYLIQVFLTDQVIFQRSCAPLYWINKALVINWWAYIFWFSNMFR